MTLNNYFTNSTKGLRKTIFHLNRLAEKSMRNKFFFNWIITGFCSKKNLNNILFDIHKWTHENIGLTGDETDEKITAPYIIIQKGYNTGDCDDHALFVFTVIKILRTQNMNIPKPKFVLLAKDESLQYSHIAVTCGGYYIDSTLQVFNKIPDQYKFLRIL